MKKSDVGFKFAVGATYETKNCRANEFAVITVKARVEKSLLVEWYIPRYWSGLKKVKIVNTCEGELVVLKVAGFDDKLIFAQDKVGGVDNED